MADIKQLKIKIQSTKNIKKITNAMEIISTIKLQKIKKKADRLREYMTTFLHMLSTIDAYTNLFPQQTSSSAIKELAILVSSDKGLCGSLNTTLFKQFHTAYGDRSQDIEVFAIGKKARDFLKRRGYTIVGRLSIEDDFVSEDIEEIYTLMGNAWQGDHYHTIVLWYNYFKNTMKQIPVGFVLSPLTIEGFKEFASTLDIRLPRRNSHRHIESTDMLLEPDRSSIIKKAYEIMMNVIVYGAILHNKTGEFASRMLAMKGAKDNATNIINNLTLAYNKARQDAITKEVLEIVGAKAVIED